MARYRTPSPGAIAAFDRAITAASMRGPRSNPGARTIPARRSGTCPISNEKIEIGDSITKTPAGWALTQHAGAAMENPQHFTKGKGKFAQTPKSVGERTRYFDDFEQSYFEGGPGEHAGFLQHTKKPVARFKQVENPSLGGAAMKYSRAHGVSLKQGWAAVKAGKANPYYENPSMGGRAMQYSRAHGVSLKEGWKAVKSGRA